jgi:hypothetical protein
VCCSLDVSGRDSRLFLMPASVATTPSLVDPPLDELPPLPPSFVTSGKVSMGGDLFSLSKTTGRVAPSLARRLRPTFGAVVGLAVAALDLMSATFSDSERRRSGRCVAPASTLPVRAAVMPQTASCDSCGASAISSAADPASDARRLGLALGWSEAMLSLRAAPSVMSNANEPLGRRVTCFVPNVAQGDAAPIVPIATPEQSLEEDAEYSVSEALRCAELAVVGLRSSSSEELLLDPPEP